MKGGCSDRLYHAEADSLTPEEVFQLYEGQIGEELGPCGDEDVDPLLEQSVREMRSAVAKARKLYAKHGDAAFALMEQDEDEYVQAIGEALSTGVYDGLAI